MEAGKHFIGGKWAGSDSRDTFNTINPANGKVLATFPKGTKKDVQKAIAAAKKAFPAWKKVPAARRGEILYGIAEELKKRKKELGKILTTEMGKVISEGVGEVQEAVDFTYYMAGEGRRLLGETVKTELPNKFAMTVRQPIGVCGLITPWNFPIAIPSWKIMPALVCGNSIVFKPASDTPLMASKFVEIIHDCGVPEGVINMVTGAGSAVGGEIVNNPAIGAVSFTGSVPVGKIVNKGAAKRLASCELELGGKNPLIVMDDANLDLAVDGTLFAAFGTAGQRCTATSRLILQEGVYDEVLEKLVKRVRKLKLGNPLDRKTDVGPVINEPQMSKILEYIKIGKKEGANLVLGGSRFAKGACSKGFFVEPTVFEAKPRMRIAQEEIFGPVLSVLKVKDLDDAIKVANGITYGLSTSIYTRNINNAFRAIDELESGLTYINAPTIGSEVQLPFGGVKDTGNGGREAGTTAIDEFTEIKTVYVDYSDKLQKAQIRD